MSLPTLLLALSLSACIPPNSPMSMSADIQKAIDESAAAAMTKYKDKGLKPEELAITVRRLNRSAATADQGELRGNDRMYTASVVKLFYLVRLANAFHDKKLTSDPEIERGAHDMIVDSCNDATAFILDLLTGTTGGPELDAKSLEKWGNKRNEVNRWFKAHGYNDINVCQKPWNEGPYGRERQFLGEKYENRNALSTNACVRLMSAIAMDNAAPLESNKPQDLALSKWMKGFLNRKVVADGGDNEQSKLFSGAVLPKGTQLWSKAGWTDTVRHDVAWFKLPNGHEYVWAIFTKAHSETDLVQFTAGELLKRLEGSANAN